LVVNWLVLALYFLDFSPVGICATALAGSLDSTHESSVQLGEHGLRLVRHHNHGCIGHHHGIVARTLTLIAQPTTAGNPDHVIQFDSADHFCSPPQMLQPTLAQGELPVPVLDEIFRFSSRAPVVSEVPRPPPREPGSLASIRTTLFLI